MPGDHTDGILRRPGRLDGNRSMKRALVSVSDKEGIIDFCRGLEICGYEIISTGGTLKVLRGSNINARAVSEITGVPEILGGRVKTLHPVIHGGILARRNEAGDMNTLLEHEIQPIDIVVVNLYPFAEAIETPGIPDDDIIEQIDIGGPCLLRAAAKNHKDVFAVVDPDDYNRVLEALATGRNADTLSFRRKLASKVYAHTSGYDRLITEYLDVNGAENE
jgi:phosphoribosylaminoimidazolecarboxamide formyltransferase/IMP cyclohydrolase